MSQQNPFESKAYRQVKERSNSKVKIRDIYPSDSFYVTKEDFELESRRQQYLSTFPVNERGKVINIYDNPGAPGNNKFN